jgi:hypothetical protein
MNDDTLAMTTLRGRRARARLPCEDWGKVGVTPGAPVPPAVPGEFVVRLPAVVSDETLRGLEAGMAALGGAGALLSWLRWVEAEVRGFPDLVEGLLGLRGAVMAAAAAGEW